MKILGIFVDENLGEGLHSISYEIPDEEYETEFDKIFSEWTDVEFVSYYLLNNRYYWEQPFFNGASLDELLQQILTEAENLEQLILSYVQEGFDKKGKNLEMLFKPLHDKEYIIPTHQLTKAKIDDRYLFPHRLLRVYAIRLGTNTFILTGGAIKLTRTMEEHQDTRTELEKLEKVKKYLESIGLRSADDLIYYYDPEI